MTWTISGWKASTIKTPSLDWGSSKGPERKDLPHTSQLILNRRSESMQSLPACVSKSSMTSPAMLKVVRSPNFCVLVLKETNRAAILTCLKPHSPTRMEGSVKRLELLANFWQIASSEQPRKGKSENSPGIYWCVNGGPGWT